jgi:T-complex protein 1 subunit alpha
MQNIKIVNSKGENKHPLKSIITLKQIGKSMKESFLVDGYALNVTRADRQMPKIIKDAKIALIDVDLTKYKAPLGVQILIKDTKKLQEVKEKELKIVQERIKMIIDSGANVIFTTQGIDESCIKVFIEAKIFACKRCDKDDLERIAKLTGGSLVSSFADLEGNESFSNTYLGSAEEVSENKIGDNELIFVKGGKTKKSQSIILRGPNEFTLDEMSRSVHDTLCVLRKVLENRLIVPGGGAVEAALSIYLEKFATTIETREQLAIAEFAHSILGKLFIFLFKSYSKNFSNQFSI